MANTVRDRLSNRIARRWLRRLDRTLDNTPSWRLLQELKHRGDLLEAEEADVGLTKGGTGKLKIGARPVDRYGLPLWRIKVEDDEPESGLPRWRDSGLPGTDHIGPSSDTPENTPQGQL